MSIKQLTSLLFSNPMFPVPSDPPEGRLPPDAVLTVTLSDASLADAPSGAVAKAVRTEGKQAPFSFVLPLTHQIFNLTRAYSPGARPSPLTISWYLLPIA